MSVRYVIKEGFAGINRARLASFTSMFSLFVAVFLIGVLVRIGFNAYEVAQSLRQQVEIEVFLDDMNQQSTNEIQQTLESNDDVESITYISRDMAREIFQEEFGVGGDALANLDFLPASFRLRMNSNAEIEEINQFVESISTYDGVDEVKFNMDLLQMLESRIETTTMVGGALGILIFLTAVILVFNTIRLTIYAKRDLIRAMKLVGATNGFIRRPFLVEGLLQGLIGGTIACLGVYVIFSILLPAQLPQIGVLDWPYGKWYFLIGGMMILALSMGWWGSRWASYRFIRDSTVYASR